MFPTEIVDLAMTGGGPQSAKIVTFCLENLYFYIKIKMKLAYQFINPFKNTLKKNIGLFFYVHMNVQ